MSKTNYSAFFSANTGTIIAPNSLVMIYRSEAMRKSRFTVLSILIFVCLMLSVLTASARGEDTRFEGTIMNVDLGVTSLNLSVGESYTFRVTFEPEDNPLITLNWYVTDDSVIRIDPLTDTVTALSQGEARIYAETLDHAAHAVCDVTVGNSAAKNIAVPKSADDYFGLTRREMKKITSITLRPYLDFIAGSVVSDEDRSRLMDRSFDVLAAVKPGTEESESLRAEALGIRSDPLTNLNSITLIGTAGQIIAFVKDNNDLIEVFDLGSPMAPDPIEEETGSGLEAKLFSQWGNANALSNFNFARRLGLTGKGQTIAVIDTAIDSNHEQVAGRVIREACFSESGSGYFSACSNNSTGSGAAYPKSAVKVSEFNHGMHVTAIAAGKDGVAPKANIVFIAAASEDRWTCKPEEKSSHACKKGSDQCCSSSFYSSNQAKAYEYLLKLASEGLRISSVNMSYGAGEYKNVCDSATKWRKEYFDKLVNAGMLPVVSAGNSSHNDAVGTPACVSSAYTVAALADTKTPFIAKYSNFNKPNVDIAAPGTYIYSAVLANVNKNFQTTCSKNCYQKMSGTSMAAPMVTGSIALVKQLYPGKTASEAGKFLKGMTSKSVSKRVDWNNKVINSWNYSKPVLNMNNILSDFTIKNSDISARGQSAKLSFSDTGIKLIYTYKLNVFDVASKAKIACRFRITAKGGIRTIEIDGKGNFKNGNLYRVEITRVLKGNKKTQKTVKYFSPFDPMTSLTAAPRGQGVDLNLYSRIAANKPISAVYTIYNASNKTVVKQISAANQNLPQTVTGLTNGQKYYVTAKPNRTAMIDGKPVVVWGMESDPVYFVPLSTPFNCRATAWSVPQISGEHNAKFSCSADANADGIRIYYRDYNDNSGKLNYGCASEKGSPFECRVNNIDRDKKYQFFIVKYKTDNKNNISFSESAVINHNCGDGSDMRPEKPMIYLKNKNTAVISAAESKAAGITAYSQNAKGNLTLKPFCDERSRSCQNTGAGKTNSAAFLIMRWNLDGNGNRIYSPAAYAANLWSAR